MAIYHLTIKPLRRAEGRTCAAAAAYRAAARLVHAPTGVVHDYRRRRGVEHTEIVLPPSTPDWALDRQELWDQAEQKEKRKDSCVAREHEISLPFELNEDQRLALARAYTSDLAARHKCAVDFSIHAPTKKNDERNFHVHVLCSTRKIDAAGFGEKCDREKTKTATQRKADLQIERKTWETFCNRALQLVGSPERVDCRPLSAQLPDQIAKIEAEILTAEEKKMQLLDEQRIGSHDLLPHPRRDEIRAGTPAALALLDSLSAPSGDDFSAPAKFDEEHIKANDWQAKTSRIVAPVQAPAAAWSSLSADATALLKRHQDDPHLAANDLADLAARAERIRATEHKAQRAATDEDTPLRISQQARAALAILEAVRLLLNLLLQKMGIGQIDPFSFSRVLAPSETNSAGLPHLERPADQMSLSLACQAEARERAQGRSDSPWSPTVQREAEEAEDATTQATEFHRRAVANLAALKVEAAKPAAIIALKAGTTWAKAHQQKLVAARSAIEKAAKHLFSCRADQTTKAKRANQLLQTARQEVEAITPSVKSSRAALAVQLPEGRKHREALDKACASGDPVAAADQIQQLQLLADRHQEQLEANRLEREGQEQEQQNDEDLDGQDDRSTHPTHRRDRNG